jgi:two-component system, NarL family, response regulator LiaR
MSGEGGPIRVAIVNDYEIVVAGVAAVLKRYESRVEVVEIDADLPVISEVDVVLYDTFGQAQGNGVDMADLVSSAGARVVVFSWNVQPELVEESLARGAVGYLPKSVSAEELVSGIEAAHRGTVVRPQRVRTVDETQGSWPGRKYGLTPRESEVIALITQGLSNREIAERTYLSVNSVKTHVRTAYAKIGVDRRSKAVMWGVRHGFVPDRLRVVDPDTGELTLHEG